MLFKNLMGERWGREQCLKEGPHPNERKGLTYLLLGHAHIAGAYPQPRRKEVARSSSPSD